ncbi:hypothetical protein J1605_005721 [Eschrichtius robustus]|uniref:Uncharacterized protein n=1 Tax=Eschrichtius robustus TaxID=9764 RepID=A0AB34H3G0_ESCRO|nr:hypothetical protein J1605_005721 [Eschrichtius robustus]
MRWLWVEPNVNAFDVFLAKSPGLHPVALVASGPLNCHLFISERPFVYERRPAFIRFSKAHLTPEASSTLSPSFGGLRLEDSVTSHSQALRTQTPVCLPASSRCPSPAALSTSPSAAGLSALRSHQCAVPSPGVSLCEGLRTRQTRGPHAWSHKAMTSLALTPSLQPTAKRKEKKQKVQAVGVLVKYQDPVFPEQTSEP